jgi:hypothetical protein
MIEAQRLDSVVRDNAMARAPCVGLVVREVEVVRVESSSVLEIEGCVEKRLFVGLDVVEIGEPSESV